MSWQAQHFRKVKYCQRNLQKIENAQKRGRVQEIAAADVRKAPMLANSGSFGSKIATFKYASSTRSILWQLGLENRNF